MSLVSPDSIRNCHYGVTHETKNDILEKKKDRDRAEGEADRKFKKNITNIDLSRGIDANDCDKVTDRNNATNKIKGNKSTNTEHTKTIERQENGKNELKRLNDNIFHITENTDHIERRKRNKNYDSSKNKNYTGDKELIKLNNNERSILNNIVIKNEDAEECLKKNVRQHFFTTYLFSKSNIEITNKNQARSQEQQNNHNNETTIEQNKKQHTKVLNKQKFLIKNSASNLLRRTNEKWKRKSKWRINSGVLISLVLLNVAGVSSADTSTFSSTLTSRMIATFLGYPSTCSLGNEVRACTLTLTCWLRGGTRLRGCGGWLFSCCGLPEPNRETFDNSIPSSEWKYKPPSNLRQVPQRSVVPNNVFRRRVDDDVTQMECGLPSSRILQKRIIGGREARFAEFPWQAHVRISEFQCGGVLVSRRYVATAAHCVSRAHTRDIAVWLGAIDTSATHHPARKLGVIQKILHPLFQFRMTQPDRYDIALLKLSRPITYMAHILPICLPDHELDLRGRSGVIAGWGKTDASNGHTGTNLLRSATVPILSKEQCINWHQSKQISVEIHSEMICAGHSDGHQDACLGDSGGPLIVLDNGRYYLVGITSAGFGCGVDHQPGIYHNVKITANWIRSVISPPVNYNDNYIN